MSYGFGDDFGNDQIHVAVDDVREHLGPFDANRPNGVKTINARETRLRKKIKQYTPSLERKQELAREKPDFFTRDGMYETRRRQDIRDNIELKYYGDKELRAGPSCNGKDCLHKEHFVQVKKQLNASKNHQNDQQNQMSDMYQDMMAMEKKNNMLVMFVFFLAVVILVQYSKLRNDPRAMQFLVMPGQATSPNSATPATPLTTATPVATAVSPGVQPTSV